MLFYGLNSKSLFEKNMENIGYPIELIALFLLLVTAFVALDLWLHRGDKPVSLFNASVWSVIWILLALAFAGYLAVNYGGERAALFLSGYALEKALSIDNLMVFVAVFAAFSVPEGYRHRILYWGIIGAIIFRLIFVVAGSALYALGAWVELLFALIILWTAMKMLQQSAAEAVEDYSQHWSVCLFSKILPVFPRRVGNRFFLSTSTAQRLVKEEPEYRNISLSSKAWFYVTPLFLCLLTIEVVDILFAFDSVPAIIAITKDPLLVYTAIIFAILGLRSLYFVLAALQRYLRFLTVAVVVLLFYIGGKLLIFVAADLFFFARPASLTAVERGDCFGCFNHRCCSLFVFS
jgi:tellurite resistance protein TerC